MTFDWADAWRLIPRSGPVYVAGCCGEPAAALAALEADPELGRGRTLTGVWIPEVNRYDPTAFGPGMRARVPFATRALRDGLDAGRIDLMPMTYTATADWLRSSAGLAGAVMQVSPPRDGMVSLGISGDFSPAALASGAVAIAQINPAMPAPPSAPRIPVDRFASLIEQETPLLTYDAGPLDPATRRIAEIVAGLVGSGDHLQLGLGKVQAAVLDALHGARGMGFHGGMISTPFLARHDEGCFALGATAGVALGDRTLYDRVSDLPGLRFAEVPATHAAPVLAAVPRLVSVNSVIEVDLFGQANAEFLAGQQVSGQGGLCEFLRGSRMSKGGRGILALPSTARGGTVSRILPCLAPGTPVTVGRADADIVVTEHGIAELRHKGPADRARALIAIADPAFREDLSREWTDRLASRVAA